MVGTQAVTFAVLIVVLIVLSLVLVPDARPYVVLSIPLAALFAAEVLGIALVVGCLNVLFRDVEHVMAAALLPWFFVTPILWSSSTLGDRAERHQTLLSRAPLGEPRRAADLRRARRDLVGARAALDATSSISLVAAFVALALGAIVFRSVDDRIAVEL